MPPERLATKFWLREATGSPQWLFQPRTCLDGSDWLDPITLPACVGGDRLSGKIAWPTKSTNSRSGNKATPATTAMKLILFLIPMQVRRKHPFESFRKLTGLHGCTGQPQFGTVHRRSRSPPDPTTGPALAAAAARCPSSACFPSLKVVSP